MKRIIVILGVLSLSLSSVMVRLSTAPSSVLVVYRVFFCVVAAGTLCFPAASAGIAGAFQKRVAAVSCQRIFPGTALCDRL